MGYPVFIKKPRGLWSPKTREVVSRRGEGGMHPAGEFFAVETILILHKI